MFSPHKIDWTPEKASRLWDYYGSNPSYRGTFFGFQNGRYFVEYLNRIIPLSSRTIALDVGCGQGDVMEAVSKFTKHISGTDASVANRARVMARFKGVGVYQSLKDAPGASFDLVTCTEVVEHLTDEELEGLLSEVKRVLSPNGFAVFTTPNNENYSANVIQCPDCGCEFHRWQHRRIFTSSSLISRMELSGFKTAACKEVAWAHPLRRAVGFIKPIPKNGLIYVGR
jgi:2-polyprenyl-3-methyl-5-hydroxy-6-metoxy-1,4-benzoquinol methylase